MTFIHPEVKKQQEAVTRNEESPCQCLVYHPKVGSQDYNALLEDWLTWRKLSLKLKGTVDKDWLLMYLVASQNCPYQREEG